MEDLPSNGKAALVEVADRLKALDSSNWTDHEFVLATSLLRQMATKYGVNIQNIPNDTKPDKGYHYARDLIINTRGAILVEAYAANANELIEYYESGSADQNFGFAKLTSEEKKDIHSHLAKVRQLIETSNIIARKKNKLFAKLNSLVAEIDRLGTRTDAFFSFLGDLAFVAGDMAEKAKPAIDEVKDIMRIIMRSRAAAEGVSLPKPEDFPQLPPPNTI
jgi:hypothetical protein